MLGASVCIKNKSFFWLRGCIYALMGVFIAPYLLGLHVIFFYFRMSKKSALFLALISFIPFFLLSAEGAGFAYSFFIVPAGWVAFFMAQKNGFGAVLFKSVLMAACGFCFSLAAVCVVQKQMPQDYWQKSWGQQVQFVEQHLDADPLIKGWSNLEDFKEKMKEPPRHIIGMMGVCMLLYVSLLIAFAYAMLSVEQKEKYGFLPTYFSAWVLPDYFVWPTIGFGFMVVFGEALVKDIGLNGLYILLAVYFLQGLSIMRYFLDTFKVEAFFRVFVYAAGITFLWQQVIALGFFDQWFDFRSRVK